MSGHVARPQKQHGQICFISLKVGIPKLQAAAIPIRNSINIISEDISTIVYTPNIVAVTRTHHHPFKTPLIIQSIIGAPKVFREIGSERMSQRKIVVTVTGESIFMSVHVWSNTINLCLNHQIFDAKWIYIFDAQLESLLVSPPSITSQALPQ